MLGPTLFLLYINDLDDNIKSNILKFADDTKFFGPAGAESDIGQLQHSLERAQEWAENWQMLFNPSKCKCLHLGYGNRRHSYHLGETTIENVTQEKDLGIIFTEDMESHEQVERVVKRANQILGVIKRAFANRSKELILPLYESLIRPHLEYCCQAWNPRHQADIRNIEAVQRRR